MAESKVIPERLKLSDAAPSTQAHDDAAASGSTEEVSRSGHKHGMPSSGGVGDISVRATSTSNTSVADVTEVAITLPSGEVFDTDNLHDVSTNNTRLTPSSAGKWLIFGNITWISNATGWRNVQIRVNGGASPGNIANVRVNAISGGDTSMTIATIWDLSASEFVELIVLHNSGSTLTVRGSSGADKSSSHFGMIKLA